MKKLFITLLSLMALATVAHAQVKWISFEKAVELNKKNPKKILIDVYTDWCGYCKVMDRNTFSNTDIANLINTHYYPVKFNAESKEDVVFAGHTYKYDAKNKVHELAIAILQGKLSYPSIAYMNEDNQLLTVVPGYQTPDQLKPILNYFGEDHYKSKTWDDYQKSLASTK